MCDVPGSSDDQPSKGRADHLASHRFKPGQSGNPSGISSAAKQLQKALEGDWQDAHKRLRELLFSADEKVALEAAKFYVDHIKGKAKQAITGDEGGPVKIDLSVVEMLRKLAEP